MLSLHEIIKFEEFDNLPWVSQQVVEGFITGMHRSPYHGFSVEFAEHRLYNQGEATRHIDWKLYARTDKLFVKKYEEETNLRCMVVIDTSSSMLFPFNEKSKISKLSFSIYSAAALIYLIRKQRDAVGLTLFSDEIELQTQVKLSESHSKMLYAELNNCLNKQTKNQLDKPTNIAETLHLISESQHKRSLVILFTDMFSGDVDKIFEAIEHLRYNKHEVVLFHISDKEQEEQFNFPNRPLRFVDVETGLVQKLNPNEVRKDYKKYYNSFLESIRLKCQQYNVEFADADINNDFKSVLIPFLLKRQSLF